MPALARERGLHGARPWSCFDLGCWQGICTDRTRRPFAVVRGRRHMLAAGAEGPRLLSGVRDRVAADRSLPSQCPSAGSHSLAVTGFSDDSLWTVLLRVQLFWGSALFAYVQQKLAGAPVVGVARSQANGAYVLDGHNHGRPVFRHLQHQVFVYFWDSRGGAAWQGWWLGPHVGSEVVWSFNPAVTPFPPEHGWRVPWNGSVDKSIRFTGRDTPGSNSAPSLPAAAPAPGASPPPVACPHAASAHVAALAPAPTGDHAAQCPVCLEPLWVATPSVFVCNGRRLCCHVLCHGCAQRVAYRQQHCAAPAWARLLRCPLCRAEGVSLVEKFPSIRASPRRWFSLCDVGWDGLLSRRELADGLACILPTTHEAAEAALAARVDGNCSLWETWCGSEAAGLTFDVFQACVLPWLEPHLAEASRPPL